MLWLSLKSCRYSVVILGPLWTFWICPVLFIVVIVLLSPSNGYEMVCAFWWKSFDPFRSGCSATGSIPALQPACDSATEHMAPHVSVSSFVSVIIESPHSHLSLWSLCLCDHLACLCGLFVFLWSFGLSFGSLFIACCSFGISSSMFPVSWPFD